MSHVYTYLIINRSWANKKKRRTGVSEQEETGFLIGATEHLERVSRQTQAGLGAKKKKWRILSQFPDWPVQRILVGESPKARRFMTQFPRMR